jgi:hypothetical protein
MDGLGKMGNNCEETSLCLSLAMGSNVIRKSPKLRSALRRRLGLFICVDNNKVAAPVTGLMDLIGLPLSSTIEAIPSIGEAS